MSPTPPRRALVIIDVQNEYFGGGLPIAFPPPEQALQHIVRAMDAAQAAGVPVVLVQQDAPAASPIFGHGSHGWQLHPEVARRPHDLLVSKALPSALAGTPLADWLAGRGIDTVAVAGFMTHNCIASTLIDATHRGLQGEMLSDATGSLPYRNAAGAASAEEIQRVVSVVLHSRFAALASTSEWIAAVQAGTALPRGNILASSIDGRG